jgi:addiction module HigA family antidote
VVISRKALMAGEIDFSGIVSSAATPAAPVTPGELLREEWLEPLGLTAYRLAKDIGVPTNRVGAILAGERAITADTALRLARYFGTDAESWINLQTQYDLAVERHAHGEEILRRVRPRAVAE